MTVGSDGEIGKNPVYMGIVAFLCVIAVLLNIIVMIAVVKFGRSRASIDIFIMNLAVSDILHSGIVTPVYFKNAAVDHQDFYGNNHVCKLIMFLPLFSVMGAILTIVAIAIDRYRVIVLQKHLGMRGALITIVSVWLLSILVSAPQIYEYNVYDDVEEYDPNVTYKSCGSEGIVENFETIYASLVFSFAFLVPLFILFTSYTKLVLFVWRHGKRFRKTKANSVRASGTDTSDPEVMQASRMTKMLSERMVKILKMLICITATFIVLWTPYFILFGMTEIMGLDDTSNFTEWPHVVCRTMTVVSTISNPVLYLAFSQTFRNAICGIFKVRQNPQPSSKTGKSKTNRPRDNKIRPFSVQEGTPVPCRSTADAVEIYTIPLTSYMGNTGDFQKTN